MNFLLTMWVIKAYNSYWYVESSCSMLFCNFGLNILIWEISPRLFKAHKIHLRPNHWIEADTHGDITINKGPADILKKMSPR